MRFIDEYPPEHWVGFPFVSTPRFSTDLVEVDSGAEWANSNWQNPKRRLTAPQGVRCHEDYEELLAHWMVMAGPAHTWPIRDPTDFASAPLRAMNVAYAPDPLDQPLGTGDGGTTGFQLIKRYQRGVAFRDRNITLPIVASVVIAVDGVALDPLDYSVEREGGRVEFNLAPAPGAVLTAGYLFDCCVRFESDDTFDAVVRSMMVSGFADIPLIEVPLC